MAKKAEDAVLSKEMLRVLQARRDQGDAAYPPTLRDLAELCGVTSSHEDVLKAVVKKAFTERAVVTEKVNRKPSLDSPVYFKEDVPPTKQKRERSGKKPDGRVEELSERMLLVLGAQRRLGDGAYPPTLRRLAELCELNGSDARVVKAANHKAMAEGAIVAAKARSKPSLDAPVILKEDVEDNASATLPALLMFALGVAPTSTKTKTDAFTTAELKKRLVPALQKPFGDALERGAERRTLPPDVAWVLIKDKPLFFLVENLRTGASRPTVSNAGRVAPPSHAPEVTTAVPARSALEFAEAFREAFERLDRYNGLTNFVKLSDLRRALPEFGREAFDAELRKMRLVGEFSLDSHEGLHGSLTPEEREAGVREAGSLLIYASRR